MNPLFYLFRFLADYIYGHRCRMKRVNDWLDNQADRYATRHNEESRTAEAARDLI